MLDDHLGLVERRRPFTRGELERLRNALDPQAVDVETRPLAGGIDTATYALRLARPGSARLNVVVRVYRGWKGDVDAKVRRDYETLQAISAATPLAPRPVLCDSTAEITGEPLMALAMVEGAPDAPPSEPKAWTEQLADTLVRIHEVPIAGLSQVERDRTPEERVARRLADPPPEPDPLWDDVAAVLPALADRLVGNPPTLIHADFWFGNTVWRDGQLTGVIDWGDARIGDPARDVAVARADLRLSGADADKIFLARYEAQRGELNDLLFWDLVAALGPIRWLAHWLAGYEELGVSLPLSEARARLERRVRADLRQLTSSHGVR